MPLELEAGKDLRLLPGALGRRHNTIIRCIEEMLHMLVPTLFRFRPGTWAWGVVEEGLHSDE
jgi:hypothetical protein